MNFFQTIADMKLAGGWTIHITTEQDNRFIVSVLFHNKAVGDKAAQMLPPMLLRGTATEIDTGFFEQITQPVKQTAALFTNMEQYLKQREVAKLASQQAKDNTSKTQKEKSEKDKKYVEAMKKVDELEKLEKYREAYVKVPEPSAFPEHEAELRKRKTELARKFSPDLFADAPAEITPAVAATTVEIATEQQEEIYDDDADNEETTDINDEYDYVND